MLVELKNGETYNGHLVNCETWMNIHLREVIFTSKDGDRFWRMPECYIRGNTIKYSEFQMRSLIKFRKILRDQTKPPGVRRRRGRGRDKNSVGRSSKGIVRGGIDDGVGRGGRGKCLSGSKPSGNRGGGRGSG